MKLVLDIFLVLHLLAFGVIFGGVIAETKNFKTGAKVNPGILHGSWLALLTGLVMAGLIPVVSPDEHLNGIALSIKGLAITGIFFIGYTYQKKDSTPKWVVPTIGALSVLAVATAVLGPIVTSA
jgi:ABC-type uncharacterized transport system permease subunit